ncbi:MAG: hypothetical protein BMS9Abin37_2238 [Acidobacteriota bacterium]|nr:MAG: hypothetical protein BMS9Abin37_2238 [Acidobacteriota bacterium]
MIRAGQHPDANDDDVRDSSELDMAARVADKAAEEALGATALPPDEQRTWARGPDAEYRQAIDEIAFLIDMRREASGLDAPIGDDAADAGDLGDIELNGVNEWGPFELIERLGGGASGEVYKVRDKHLKNHVALKLFHLERVASVELDTLLVEGRQHALVKHPNIAVIHGADENDGRVGIWMEYIDGATLQKLVEEQGTFGPAEAVNIGRELCSALAAVHQQGLTHGDIKAQNVMREKGGRIVLMDFSSSRHVELEEDSAGGLVGTPIYMAPELFDDNPSDFRSDIYALGVLLFYLVTGRHPYEATDLRELKEAVSSRKPLLLDDLRSDLPSSFVHAVHKAISWNPDARFQSAGEFQAALRDSVVADPSDTLNPYGPRSTPDLSTLVRAARVVTGSIFVASFLALIGFANEFQFNVVLHVPDNFTNYSAMSAVVVGLRSLVMSIRLVIVELVPIAVVWGLIAAFAPGTADAFRGFARRTVAGLQGADFNRLTTAFTVVCVLSFAAACFFFGELLVLLATLAESSGPRGIDVSILQTSDYYERFVLFVTQVAIVMVIGWVAVFKGLAPPEGLTATSRLMRWLSAAAIIVSLVIMASPWRLIWKNDSLPVWIGETTGYVVAEKGDEWFVYIPRAVDSQEHLVIGSDDPRITRVGDRLENIFIDS